MIARIYGEHAENTFLILGREAFGTGKYVEEVYHVFVFFFFSSRRRHTRLQGDWSSDVCSSDLAWTRAARRAASWACSAVTEASALRSLMRCGWASTSAIRSPALTCWPSSTCRRLTCPETWAPTEIGRAHV